MDYRYATEEDTSLILYFIKELADYEKKLDEVVADEKLLKEWIFDKQKAEVIFALENGKELVLRCSSTTFLLFSAERVFILKTCM